MQGRAVLAGVLAATMAASTFMLTVFGVLAGELRDDLDVERWQVGVLVTASSAVAALLSPSVGRAVDRLGARRATVWTLFGSGAALAAVAASPGWPVLLLAAAATALPQAAANPATNRAIREHVPAGRRGEVTGVKQSGVQVGVFLGGLTLPPLAAAAGWRTAALAYALVWLLGGAVARRVLPPDPLADTGDPGPTPGAAPPALPPLVRRIAVYGFLLGAGGSALFTYVPLYAEEALGTSAQVGGAAAGLAGLVGIGARIGWGRLAERRLGAVRALRLLAALAVGAPLLLVLATRTGPVLLWPAAVLTGLSASAWNAVGMLAIIEGVPTHATGRASGRVMLGFLAGLGLGAPAFGLAVDRTGGYAPGWLAASLLFVAALAVAAGAREPADTPAIPAGVGDGTVPSVDAPTTQEPR